MSYQSLGFVAFSAIVILLYYIIGRKRQLWVLAAANLVFYLIAGIKYLPFILVTMLVTYTVGRIIGNIYAKCDERLAECTVPAEKKELRAASKKKAKKVLLIALVVSIALLAVCKYTTFALNNVNLLLAKLDMVQIPMFKMILPLGISFYTFMALSYVLDIYWKRYKAEKNFLIYAVYLSYFPHVVQGPIDRFNEFKEQLSGGIDFSYENLTQGAQLALWGFFKKLVIADRLNMFVGAIVDNYGNYNGSWIILAFLVYSIQIYTDFSGCIDIVTGVSEAMGIKLRKNFNHPYFSKTMAEFWRRWHISLQEWFKDYIYYPVSASAFTKKIKKYYKNKGLKRIEELFSTCFPILVVWLVTGIWHGAAWRFVAWGLFHAALLIGSNVFEPLFVKLKNLFRVDTENFGWRFWQMVRTYLLCCIGRVFFRVEGLKNSLNIFKIIFTDTSISALFNPNAVYGLDKANVYIAIFSVLILWIVDMLQERMELRKTLAKQNIFFRWLLLFGLIFAIIIFGIYGPGYDASSFIYEQF